MPRRATEPDPPDEEALRQRRALDAFFGFRYDELRRIASKLKRGDGDVTLSPTALVNEAWLSLSGSPELGTLSAVHFKAIAARAMRRLLIDAARRRNARKRATGSAVRVAFDESVERSVTVEHDLLDLDDCLRELGRLSPRQAALVEARYFGGLTSPELAQLLGVSEATVDRDWRAARAWLKSQFLRR